MAKKNPNVRIVIDIPGEWSPNRQATIIASRGDKSAMRQVAAETQQQITDGIWAAVESLTDFEGIDIDIPTRLSKTDKYKPSKAKTQWSRLAANEPGYVKSPYTVESRYNVPAGEDWLDYARCEYAIGERVYLPDYGTPGRIQRLFANATRAKVQLLSPTTTRGKKKLPVVSVDVARLASPADFDKQHDLTTREGATAAETRLATDKTDPDGALKKQALL